MKTNNLIKIILTPVLALALAAALTSPYHSYAEDGTAKGGGAKLQELTQIKTQAEAEALKPGDSVAMVCPKCKSVTVRQVVSDSKLQTKSVLGEKHLCPGCGGSMEMTGMGKDKHTEFKHVCSKCGSDTAFCCATKPGSGSTEGMEKK